MSSTTYTSTKDGQHFLDNKVTPTPQDKKKKVKDVDDKVPSRNNFVQCSSCIFAECEILVVSSSTWHQ